MAKLRGELRPFPDSNFRLGGKVRKFLQASKNASILFSFVLFFGTLFQDIDLSFVAKKLS